MINNIRMKVGTKVQLSTKSNLDFRYGEIIYCTDTSEVYMYNGNSLIKIADQQMTEMKDDKVLQPRICKCCGAPMHTNICEYCGVEYY